ncbi:hypothetical protein [Micromonospora sp. DT229]|uniref:hypothetical protein n=1 Tax=Micromonospora sp. DT229 TaxID=3393430 RepID=UPI003CF93212
MAPLETVGQVADRAVELGIVAPAAVASLADIRDEPLSYYGDDNARALIDLMDELGVGVRVDPKVDTLLSGYRDLFDRFTACTGGAVTITDVELLDGDDGERIRMLVNGREFGWHLECGSGRYLDMVTIFEIHTFLLPDGNADPRVFISLMDANEESGYVFADPVAFSTLAEELQVKMD